MKPINVYVFNRKLYLEYQITSLYVDFITF